MGDEVRKEFNEIVSKVNRKKKDFEKNSPEMIRMIDDFQRKSTITQDDVDELWDMYQKTWDNLTR